MFESAFVEQVQIMHEIDILMYSTRALAGRVSFSNFIESLSTQT